jgi:hypothetical protein
LKTTDLMPPLMMSRRKLIQLSACGAAVLAAPAILRGKAYASE